MTVFEHLINKKNECLSKMNDDVDLAIFYKHAAQGFEDVAKNLTLSEANAEYVGTSNN